MRFLRKMRIRAGRLVRDIERKIEGQPDLVQAFEPKLERIKQFLAQKPNDKNKIYALHAPEVECIAKGKARTRYEFGVKVSIAVTNARANGGQFVVGIHAVPGLPYDGHTLKDQIAQVERLTGVAVTRAYVDKGYRGHGLETPDVHVSQSPVKRSPTIKRELRRRSAIEPIIGHAKSDGLLERNRLAGTRGDAINAILVGAGHNIRLLLAWLRRLLSFFLALLVSALSPSTSMHNVAASPLDLKMHFSRTTRYRDPGSLARRSGNAELKKIASFPFSYVIQRAGSTQTLEAGRVISNGTHFGLAELALRG